MNNQTTYYTDTISGEKLFIKEYRDRIYYYKQTPMGPVKHRVDGPATLHKHTKGETWIRNGELHRMDGPAFTSGDGTLLAWYVDGIYMHKSEMEYLLRQLKND